MTRHELELCVKQIGLALPDDIKIWESDGQTTIHADGQPENLFHVQLYQHTPKKISLQAQTVFFCDEWLRPEDVMRKLGRMAEWFSSQIAEDIRNGATILEAK